MPASITSTVRSSDLGDWAFCAIKLYYERVQRRTPTDSHACDTARATGSSSHAAHEASVASAMHVGRIASRLTLIGALALALMLLFGLAGCSPGDVSDARGWLGAFGAGLIVLAILLHRGSAEVRRRTRIPAHLRMLSSDAGLRRGQLLRDDALALLGRPDYVFTRKVGLRKRVFTAEYKSRTAPRRPFRGHVLQTAAGIHLARVHYGRAAATTGYLVYSDSSVPIELTPALARELEGAVAAVHALYASPVPPARNHSSRARCAACPFSADCPSSLSPTPAT